MTEPDDSGSEREDALLHLLVETLEPVAPPSEQRARLFAALGGRARYLPFAADVARLYNVPVRTARVALSRASEADAWLRGGEPGSALLSDPALCVEYALIARLAPGTSIAAHTHKGRELTFVLDGVLRDDTATFRAGELMAKAKGSRHTVHVDGQSPCVVVFGVLRDTT